MQDDMTGRDLEIYYSFSKNPDSNNFIQKFINKPKSFKILPYDSQGKLTNNYEHPYVYISFISEIGCLL